MTPTQQEEWAERLQLVSDFARGAYTWALRSGMSVDEARMAVARVAVLAVSEPAAKAA